MDRRLFKFFWILIITSIAATNSVFAADWPMFRNDASRRGEQVERTGFPIIFQWSASLKPGVHYSSPSISDTLVCIASLDGKIYGFDAVKNGEMEWCYTTAGRIYSSPAIADRMVYIGSVDGNLYALDAVNGETKWVYKIGDNINSSSVVYGGILYFGSNNGTLYALNAATGETIWSYYTGSPLWSSPAASDTTVYIGSYNGIIYAFDSRNGTLKWSYKTDGSIRATPAIADGVVYISSYDGKVYAINSATGNAIAGWPINLGVGIYSSPAIGHNLLGYNQVYIGGSNGYLYALDCSTGNIKWQAQVGDHHHSIYSSPAVCKNLVFVGSTNGKVYAFDVFTGELKWSHDAVAPVESSIAISRGWICFISEDGKLWIFRSTDAPPVTMIEIGFPKYGVMPTFVTSATEIKLSATDDISGVDYTEYKIDDASTWNTGVQPIILNILSEGTHTVWFRSIDICGHLEQANSITIFVDNSPPVTKIDIGQPKYMNSDTWITSHTPITLTADDSSGCGVERIEYRIDQDSWVVYTSPFVIPSEGGHTIFYRSIDYLGNVETKLPWTISYEANELPQDATPSWQRLQVACDTDIEQIEPIDEGNNAFHTRITATGEWGGLLYYKIGECGPNEIGNVIEARVKVLETGEWEWAAPALEMFNYGYGTSVYINKDHLYVQASGGAVGRSDIIDFTSFHTIRAAMKGNNLSVYVDGLLSVSLPVSYQGPGTENELRITAGNSLAPGESAEALFDYVKFSNRGIILPGDEFKSFRVFVDNSPPTTTLLIGSPKYSSGIDTWVTSSTPITITADDSSGCGVERIEYRLDNMSIWNTTTSPGAVHISEEGTHTLWFRGIDNVGNIEQVNSITLFVDNSPPVTSISIGQPIYTNSDTWITSHTPITLTADDSSGCGVERIEYRIDQDTDWETYSQPFIIPDEGAHTIFYRSLDHLGNVEEYPGVPVDENVVALWHMDEASGDSVLDSSGNGNNGTAYGTTIVDGKYGKARQFNSTNDYIVVPDAPSLQLPGSMTIEAWIFPIAYPQVQGKIVSKGYNGHSMYNEYDLFLEPDGSPSFFVHCWHSTSGTYHWKTVKGMPLCLNQWHHVAATYDIENGVMGIYTNGVLVNTAPNTFVTNVLNYDLYIGRDEESWVPGGYREFTGIIDELRISNIARTQEELKASMAGWKPMPKSTKVMVDNTPPTVTLHIGYPHYPEDTEAASITHVTSATTYSLTFGDTGVGIDTGSIWYSIDTGTPLVYTYVYTKPFTLASYRYGLSPFRIKWWTSDRLGNTSPKYEVKNYRDDSPPLTILSLAGPKYFDGINTYVSIATTFTLSVAEKVAIGIRSHMAGLKLTSYKIDESEIKNIPFASRTYTGTTTFNLYKEGIGEGEHTVYYYSSDNVYNREEIKSYRVIADNTAPTFTIEVDRYFVFDTSPLHITVRASERLKEIAEAKVVQSGSPGTAITLSTSDSITWVGDYEPVTGYNGIAKVYVKAKDLIGFTGEDSAQFIVFIPAGFAIQDVSVSPSPFNPLNTETPNAKFSYTIAEFTASTVTLRIFNRDGALVRRFVATGVLPDIPQEILWDGKNQQGSLVLEGTYLYEFTASRVLEDGSVRYALPKFGKLNVIYAEVDSTGTQLTNPQNATLDIIPVSPEDIDTCAFVALATQELAPVSSIYDLQPDGAFYEPPATLIIYYNPVEVSGFEEKLKIYKFNTETGEWRALPDQVLDIENHCIRVPITGLSYYSILFSRAEVSITPPIAELTSPAQMAFVDNNVEIKGTAKAMLFSNYKLEYGKGEIPDSWTLIEPIYGYPVDSSTLTIWNTAGLEGIHTLRLTVSNRVGDISTDQVAFIIDNTPPTTTTLSIGEPKYNYGNGIPLVVTSHTPFIFTALDSGTIPSGISQTECALDNDTSWVIITRTGEDTLTGAKIFTFFIPLTHPDGQHILYYRSIDNVGNTEESRSITVILDNTSPVATLLYPSKEDIGICKVINSNTVSIIGTTIDVHFSSYKVEIKAMREGETPAEWVLLNQMEGEIETHVLAIWNTTQFNDGWYYIRIVSSDKVNNTSNDTVSVYLGNPEVKLTFGSKGNDIGEFKEPYGIAFSPTQTGTDNSGCIFVTDNKNDRVQKFDLNGNFLLSFNGRSEECHKLKKPSGIAVDPESSCVFVADRDNDRIQAFDLSGNFILSFGEKYDIKKPEQVSAGMYYTYSDTSYTCTKAVYVADRKKDRIAIFDYSGNLLATIPDLDNPEGVFALIYLQYPGPSQISIYVANTDENIITLYTSALTPTLSIKGFDHPRAVCADNRGYIYVSDSTHNSIKRFNRYGELLMQFTGTCTTALDKPAGICLDREGNLWLTDEENDRIIKIGAPAVDDTFSRRIFTTPKQTMTIKDAYAYPVPFKPNSGLGHTVINFKLYSPQNVILRIYNIAGELIFEKTGITAGTYQWNAKNNQDEPVASGVYIYFLTDDTKEKKIGKIMIIR